MDFALCTFSLALKHVCINKPVEHFYSNKFSANYNPAFFCVRKFRWQRRDLIWGVLTIVACFDSSMRLCPSLLTIKIELISVELTVIADFNNSFSTPNEVFVLCFSSLLQSKQLNFVASKDQVTFVNSTKSHSLCPSFVPKYWMINLLTPNVNYSGRTAPLTSKVAFYIFIQQIYVLNILNIVYTLRFFLFKMQFVS